MFGSRNTRGIVENSAETRERALVRTRRRRVRSNDRPPVFREPARVPLRPAPAPHVTMAPMTKAETAAANEDSNGAATELWRNTRVLGIILVYCAIGSQLSVVNKVVVTFIPLPNFILLAQFTATTVMLLAAHYTGSVEIEPLTWQIAGIFSPLVLTFFALLYAGMEVMKYAPLETFITVKSMTPVLFSACEYLFLGRALPNLKSTAALLGIVLGAATYVKVDAYASYHAYAFCVLFLIAAVSEGLVAKTTIEKVKLNNWSRSYNINVLSIPLAAAQMLAAEEHLHFFREDNEWSAKTVTLLVASCVMGLGMSVATMWIREAISATSVSVVATCNKFISELVNWVIWNKHTTSDGLGAVLVIMVCGVFYEQAPLRVKGQGYVREEICPCLPRSWLGFKTKPKTGDAGYGAGV